MREEHPDGAECHVCGQTMSLVTHACDKGTAAYWCTRCGQLTTTRSGEEPTRHTHQRHRHRLRDREAGCCRLRERTLLQDRDNGLTLGECAQKYGTTLGRVRSILRRAHAKVPDGLSEVLEALYAVNRAIMAEEHAGVDLSEFRPDEWIGINLSAREIRHLRVALDMAQGTAPARD